MAFGEKRDADGKIHLVDQPGLGFKVLVASGLSGNPGKFTQRTIGTVVAVGDFDDSNYGQSNDLVLLRLDKCLGPNAALITLGTYLEDRKLPTQSISLLHVDRYKDGTRRFYQEDGCTASSILTSGIYAATCHAEPGDSGSRFVKKTAAGFDVVGMLVSSKPTANLSVGINVERIQEFLEEERMPQQR